MAAVLDFSFDKGGMQSLSVLHAQFCAPLQRFFLSFRLTTADAEDLTQDVFVRLAAPGGQRKLRRPDAFVFTVARNLVRDRARRLHTKAVAQTVTLDEIELRSERPTPDEYLELAQRMQQVEEVMAVLTPRTRQAFVQHRIEGDSYAEIARHMGISVSMVEKHIMSAIRALRGVTDGNVRRNL